MQRNIAHFTLHQQYYRLLFLKSAKQFPLHKLASVVALKNILSLKLPWGLFICLSLSSMVDFYELNYLITNYFSLHFSLGSMIQTQREEPREPYVFNIKNRCRIIGQISIDSGGAQSVT
jgi:hypothetical protein